MQTGSRKNRKPAFCVPKWLEPCGTVRKRRLYGAGAGVVAGAVASGAGAGASGAGAVASGAGAVASGAGAVSVAVLSAAGTVTSTLVVGPVTDASSLPTISQIITPSATTMAPSTKGMPPQLAELRPLSPG